MSFGTQSRWNLKGVNCRARLGYNRTATLATGTKLVDKGKARNIVDSLGQMYISIAH